MLVWSLGSVTLKAELVGLWRFDADVSPQPDSSGKGHDAPKGGDPDNDVVWANDPVRGGVMEFDGFHDYLEVEDTDALSIEGDITIMAWANFSQFDTWNSIVGKTGLPADEEDPNAPGRDNHNRPAPYDLYTMQNGEGWVQFYLGDGRDGIQAVRSELTPELETWQHIAVTANADGDVFHYLNGEPNGEGFVSVARIDLDQNLFIGSRADFVTNMFGRLDDVAIFNEVLTQEQIQKVMSGDFSDYIGGGLLGDFDASGALDVADIDELTAAVLAGSTDTKYDVNNDSVVSNADRDTWINDLRKTWPGDSNLDLQFNSSDFVQVFQRGQYEDTVAKNSKWGDGDWNGDGEFDSADFVSAFQAGGYEKGPRPAVGAVPEPAAWLLLAVGILPLLRRLRR
jgi:hypothetical protein